MKDAAPGTVTWKHWSTVATKKTLNTCRNSFLQLSRNRSFLHFGTSRHFELVESLPKVDTSIESHLTPYYKWTSRARWQHACTLTSDFHTTYAWELDGCTFLCSHLLGEKSAPVLPEDAAPAPRTRKGKSPAVFLLALFTVSKSKWKLEEGDTSCGMEGEDSDGLMGSFSAGILARKAARGAGRSGDAPASRCASVGVSQCLIIAGSRLLVWRSLLLVMALDAGEEQEKTLLRSPCAADMSPYFSHRLRSLKHPSSPHLRLLLPVLLCSLLLQDTSSAFAH